MSWESKAVDNETEWGSQSIEVLLLALGEEYGELIRAYLQYVYEDGDIGDIEAELADMMALGYQIDWRFDDIERHPDAPRCIECGFPIDRHRHDYRKTKTGHIHVPNCQQ